MSKGKRILLILGIVFIVFLVRFIYYAYWPREAYTEIEYCEDLAKKINWVGSSQLRCAEIEVEGEEIVFNIYKKPFVNYDADKSMKDLIKYRNYIITYLNEHQYNELNYKKIHIYVGLYADTTMNIYNYNFMTEADMECSTDFVYYDRVRAENISTFATLTDTRVMNFFYAKNIDELDFFKDWTEAEYIYFVTYKFEEEECQYIRSLLPNCEIVFAKEEYYKNKSGK